MRATIAGSILLGIAGAPAIAQDAGVTRAEVERMLAERDAVIIALQQRLRALEQKVSGEPTAAVVPAPVDRGVAAEAESDAERPGAVAPDLLAAERALERSLVQEGTLLLPAWSAEFEPSLSYANSARDFPVLSAGTLGVTTLERNTLVAAADFRLGLPFDAQFEMSMPLVWIDEDAETFSTASGFTEVSNTGFGTGDLEIGMAKTIVRQDGWLPDIVGRVVVGTGIGESVDNGVLLGGGFPSVGGSVSFLKRQDPVVFVGTAGYRTFFEDRGIDPGDQAFFSAGLGLAISPETSLLFSVDNVFSSDFSVNGVEMPGSDTVRSVLNAGVSTILARDLLLTLNVGVGLTEDAPDYTLSISAPYRF